MATFWFLVTFVLVGENSYQPVITTPHHYSSQIECLEAGRAKSASSGQTLFYSCQPWNVVYDK